MASKREGVMLCYPYSEKRFKTQYGSQALIQRKINGDRCRAVVEDGKVVLYSSQANEIKCVQHINEELQRLLPRNLQDSRNMFELDGELYVHGWPHQLIHSVVAQKSWPHVQAGEMEYHIFDIICELPQFERIDRLLRLFYYHKQEKVKLVETKMVLSVEEIQEHYVKFVREGYEGFILRNPNALYQTKKTTDIMKCKPRCQSVARIVRMHEAKTIHGEPKDMLGAFTCVDEETGVSFNVGTGYNEAQRIEMWSKGNNNWVGERLVYKYQELSVDGVPIFPVFERMVVK